MMNKKLTDFGMESIDLDIFSLANDEKYQIWREKKLTDFSALADASPVKMRNLSQLEDSHINTILKRCRTTNLAIYELEEGAPQGDDESQKPLRAQLKVFCRRLGLVDAEQNRSQGDDGIVAIEVSNKGVGAGYIPYSNKPLSWHTDGYYNDTQNRIRGMVLHCARDASEGGVNEFFDPEIAYIRLRDENPAYVEALMHPQAMTIPENTDERSAYRPASVGPVFFLDETSGALNMRYSARTRNIVWREDGVTGAARAMLTGLLADDPLIIRHKLLPGQGIISNNVLHNRTGFSDNDNNRDNLAGRLLYRIRYKQRVGAPTG